MSSRRFTAAIALALTLALAGALSPCPAGASRRAAEPIVKVASRTTKATKTTSVHVRPGGSISDALAKVPAGGTVFVHAGTYPFLLVENRSWDRQVTVRPADGDRGSVVVDGVKLVGVSDLALVDLTLGHVGIHGGGRIAVASSPRLKGVTVKYGASDVQITGNEITGGYNGVTVHSWGGERIPQGIRIADNDIWGQVNDNIQLGIANDVVVEDNLLHDLQVNENHNDGVQSIGGRGLVIRRNRFWNQDQAVMLNATANLAPGNDVADVRLENNLIHHMRNGGIVVAVARDVQVVNNTVADTRHAGLHIEPGARGVRAWNNVLSFLWIVSGAGPLALEDHNCLGWGGTGSNDRRGDPGFEDRADYRLGSGSRCLDMGTAIEAPLEDLVGAMRGPLPDAGAWERL